jgi:hypothetical protein
MKKKLPTAGEQSSALAGPAYLVANERIGRPVKQVLHVDVAAAVNGELWAAQGHGPVFSRFLYLVVPETVVPQVELDCIVVAVMERGLRVAVEKRRGLEKFVFAAVVSESPVLDYRAWKSLIYLDKGPFLIVSTNEEKLIVMEASILLKVLTHHIMNGKGQHSNDNTSRAA